MEAFQKEVPLWLVLGVWSRTLPARKGEDRKVKIKVGVCRWTEAWNWGAGWGGKKIGPTQAEKEEGNDGRLRKKVSMSDVTGPPGPRSCLHPLPGHKWCFSGEFSNSQPNTKLIFLLISLREHLSKADAQNFKKKEGNYMAWKKRKEGMVI